MSKKKIYIIENQIFSYYEYNGNNYFISEFYIYSNRLYANHARYYEINLKNSIQY